MGKKEKVTRKDVLRIASLANLKLTDKEVETYTAQFNEILTYMDQLNELDTDKVEPLSHVLDLVNVLREDVTGPSLSREEALSNAPESDGKFFIVPKVVDTSQ
ncbi:MAG: Asp-tRNA(Asn)/Glu-tRNA(Gln) amidotransferase subunit GatC [Fidelibacterota bacterium]